MRMRFIRLHIRGLNSGVEILFFMLNLHLQGEIGRFGMGW